MQTAIPRLLKMGIKVFRPSDYYAEMAKSDEHMQKVCLSSCTANVVLSLNCL